MKEALLAKINAITIDNRTAALEMFHQKHVEMIPKVVAKMHDVDRVTAELWARRMVMSSALCIRVGITAKEDMYLMDQRVWQQDIDRMLHIYDLTPEELKQDD